MADRETFIATGAESTLSSALSDSATTVNVTDTSPFPSVPFFVTIDPTDGNREVVLASSKTATSLTVTRAQDGTTAVAHDEGAIIAQVPVAGLWTDINDRVDAVGADVTALDAAKSDTGHGHVEADITDLDHYTDTDANLAIDARVDKTFVDALDVDAASLNGQTALGLRQVVTYTSSGTFDKADHSWLRAVRVIAQGAGGGAAGIGASAGTSAGGGGGGCGIAVVAASALAASEAVTVGAGGTGGASTGAAGAAGGTSSFGAHATGSGGGGGATTNSLGGSPGFGTGDVALSGGYGDNGSPVRAGGHGGSSHLGGGGRPGRHTSTGGAGTAGGAYGGGGGGASTDGASGFVGADGADGVVIVELYA